MHSLHMNTNSNTYTLIYAAVLVVIVASALAFVSESLKPVQQSNIDTEKRLNILLSAQLGRDAAAAGDKNGYVAQLFQKYITHSYLVNKTGEVVDGDAFTNTQHQLPVFECTLDNGSLIYVVEVHGQGLWGPIWGYLSFKDDLNTIYGAVFDHKGETPGLGAEIASQAYAKQFEGKTIFENGAFVSVQVVKGGAKPNDRHAVDAVSGGTITSKALESTLYESLHQYLPFFTRKKQ